MCHRKEPKTAPRRWGLSPFRFFVLVNQKHGPIKREATGQEGWGPELGRGATAEGDGLCPDSGKGVGPLTQPCRQGSWGKLCDTGVKYGLGFPAALGHAWLCLSCFPACPGLLQQPAKESETFPSRLLENGASTDPF